MRARLPLVISVVALTAAGGAASSFSSSSAVAPLPAGWAAGGRPTSPQLQVADDTTCAPNSALVFSARGSGDQYGGDLAHNKIGAWTQGAGIGLIHEGWNVRDLQAIYPAPPVPSFKEIALAVLKNGGVNARSAAAVALIVKQFRDAASNSWAAVKSELEAAYNRCPTRPILLGGYSQGAILLRYIVPRLSQQIRKRIVSVDLIADPTEQAAVDRNLQHPTNLDGRLTTEGLDTFSGLVLNGGSFRQTAYPSSGRVYQYCASGDVVCELNLGNLAPANIANEGKIHASYGFEEIGLAASKRLGFFHALTFNFATGALTVDGQSLVLVSPTLARFNVAPRAKYGAPNMCDRTVAGSANPMAANASQWQAEWSSDSIETALTIWLHGGTQCSGNYLISSVLLGSLQKVAVVQTDLGSFTLGSPSSALPQRMVDALTRNPNVKEYVGSRCVRIAGSSVASSLLFTLAVEDRVISYVDVAVGC